jgi:hypothetical protein
MHSCWQLLVPSVSFMLGGFARNAAHKWVELRGTSETETPHKHRVTSRNETHLLVELGNGVLSTILE